MLDNHRVVNCRKLLGEIPRDKICGYLENYGLWQALTWVFFKEVSKKTDESMVVDNVYIDITGAFGKVPYGDSFRW